MGRVHREFWDDRDREPVGIVIHPRVALVFVIMLILALFAVLMALESAPRATAAPAATQVTIGADGDTVTAVQQRLASFGYTVAVDGWFGPQTATAVRHFQKVNGLAPDAVVGPLTSAALGITAGATAVSPAVRGAQTQLVPAGTWTQCPQWEQTAKFFGLPDRFDGIMYRESRCQPDARNASGATGLVQIMPMWVKHLGHCGVTSTSDLTDPGKNLCGAAHILHVQGINAWSQTR